MSMYKSLIRPEVLYGYEIWLMLDEDLQALGVFQSRVQWTIFGGMQEKDVWRRIMNYELTQLHSEPSILNVTKA